MQIKLPKGYEPINGIKYSTAKLQKEAYEDILTYENVGENGAFLYGKKRETPLAPKATPETLKLQWPLDKIYITQGFGLNKQMYSKYGLPGHNGVDFRTRFIDSPLGRMYVNACADGIIEVVRADAGGYGTHIRQRLADGSLIIYGHLTKPYVSKGSIVKAGQRIGLTGSTGASTGPHLHLELRIAGWESKTAKQYYGAVDPLKYLPPIK